jgi:glutamate-1-semialdehyde 2,1-aminomutase
MTKTRRWTRSARLFARAQQILPGGVDSPVRAFTAVGGDPVFVRRARGAEIEDVDGNRYTDYLMSWGSLIHGHAPRGLVSALARAAREGTGFGAPTEAEVKLGEKIRSMMPSVERIRFVNSGTEAAMSVVRLARAATGRDRIVKFEGGYHGHADAFLVKAGSGAATPGAATSPGVPRKVVQNTLVATYNDLRSCERLCETHRNQVAAIVVEPLAGNMGLVPPAEGFLAGLRALCDRYGALLVFDEVISGFRVAPGGAQEVWRVRPDLTCLGRVIGGGLPVGAYGGRKDLMDFVSPAGPVYQAGTLAGNPLAMTAGLWSLTALKRPLYRRLARLGALLATGLADAAREAGVPLQVNAVGSILTPFFTDVAVRDYRSALGANSLHYATFFRAMLARGVYAPPSPFEAWFLSAAHTEAAVRRTISAAREAMREVAETA